MEHDKELRRKRGGVCASEKALNNLLGAQPSAPPSNVGYQRHLAN